MSNRLQRLGVGVLMVVIGVVWAGPGWGADDDLRKEALRLNQVTGEEPIAQRIETLKKDADHAKKLLAVAAGMAKEANQPFNYNGAFILASLAREVKDVETSKLFFRICLDKADKLKSEQKQATAYGELINLALVNGKFDEAEKLGKEFFETADEGDGVVHDDTIEHITDTLKKDPASAKKLVTAMAAFAKQKGQPLNYNAAFLFGSVARELKELDTAQALLRASLDRAVKIRSDEKISAAYLELIDFFYQNKKFDEAEKVCKEFMEMRADSPELRIGRIMALLRLVRVTAMQGKTDEAFKLLEPLQKAGPDEPIIIDTYGWLLRHVGRYDDAAKAYEQMLAKLESDDLKERIRYTLSNLYAETGDIDKATEHLQTLLKKKPDDPSYNNDLGYIWADNDRNLDEAEKMIKKALEKEPDNAGYLDSMGWVLFKKKKYEESKKYLQDAVKDSDGHHAEIFDHLGDVHKALNEKADALSAWKRAVDLAGSSKRDQKRKAEIEKKIKEN